jgi:hypothetical protein
MVLGLVLGIESKLNDFAFEYHAIGSITRMY